MQLDQELGTQIKEFESRRVAEKKERKEPVMTSGGPTQEPEDVSALRKKMKDQQMLVKLDLEKQRDADVEQVKAKRAIEVSQEK